MEDRQGNGFIPPAEEEMRWWRRLQNGNGGICKVAWGTFPNSGG
jgi:hypothetical protein